MSVEEPPQTKGDDAEVVQPGVSAAEERTPTVREKILRAAEQLVSERPISDITLRDISARADLHHSLITRHFGTKEELMYEVGLRSRAEYGEIVKGSKDPIESFHRIFDYLLDDPSRARFFTQSVLQHMSEHDPPGAYPSWALHISQLRVMTDTGGPGGSRANKASNEPPLDVALVAIVTMLLMGAWTVAEDFVSSSNMVDLHIEDMRRAVHGIIDRLLRRELGIDSP